MSTLVAILPGDGIGPEVTAQAVRVLRVLGGVELHEGLIGGIAIDRTGSPLPDETVSLCRDSAAVLLGAVGGPKWDPPAPVRPELGLLGLRRTLGLFANLRPASIHPRLLAASPLKPDVLRGVDVVVVRELTGGLYFGEKHRRADWAEDVCTYSELEVSRVVRVAAGIAQGRKKRLTSVDKANVLETSRLWREVTSRVVREEFPDVQLDHQLVDSCALKLMQKPSSFDVIVTENLFGDILTDLAAVLGGSIGMLPSASLGLGTRGLYEPVHGSAPDIAGKSLANPYGAISSVAMMLRHSLGREEDARAVEKAVSSAIDAGAITADLGGSATTVQAGDAVLRALEENR